MPGEEKAAEGYGLHEASVAHSFTTAIDADDARQSNELAPINSGVSVEQAEAEFEDLQRQFTGVSRASRRQSRASQGRRNSKEGADPEKAVPVSTNSDDVSVFDLESSLRGQLDAAGEVGIKSKHIGVYWDKLTVKGIGGTANYVQTFPNAFINFFDVITPVTKMLGIGKKPVEATLLHEFQGICKPGEMVLVLGKPGSGCTTFLKTIANQRHGYTSVEGETMYGPWTAKEFNRYRAEAVYNAEDDIHHPTLTVEQTLSFALDTKMPAKRPGNMSKTAYKEHIITTLLKMFNIEHTRKTVVGDHFVRGISGGERKRVSIAEMMITNACVLSWDNSTRGLDASRRLISPSL